MHSLGVKLSGIVNHNLDISCILCMLNENMNAKENMIAKSELMKIKRELIIAVPNSEDKRRVHYNNTD